VREVVQRTRTAARRLGLGQAYEIEIEGESGRLLITPSELGAAALLSRAPLTSRHAQTLRELIGVGESRGSGGAS
jgi:hypothetical protein